MTHAPVTSRRSLAAGWIVANTLGWAATMGAFQMLPRGLKPIACVIIAGAQWRALHRQAGMSLWWMAGTAVGWFGGLWVATADFWPDAFWAGGIGGAISGILQCLTLWRRAASRSTASRRTLSWAPVTLVASEIGWVAGVCIGLLIYVETGESLAYVLGGALAGIVIGSVSAPALLWLLDASPVS